MKNCLFVLILPLFAVAQATNKLPVGSIPHCGSNSFTQQTLYVLFTESEGFFEVADTSHFSEGHIEVCEGSSVTRNGKIEHMEFSLHDIDHPGKKLPVCKIFTCAESEKLSKMELKYIGNTDKKGCFRLEGGRKTNKYYFLAVGYPPVEISFKKMK